MISKLRARLSYANVIATVALFVALGGGAYAAARIDSGDVENNSLKSADLKNQKAVKGKDVKDDQLTGDDIDESSLGTVPNASKVDTLVSVANVNTVDEGSSATLATYGPFTLTGACAAAAANTEARVNITTTEVGSAAAGQDNAEGTFNPADGPLLLSDANDAPAGEASYGDGYDDTFTAFAPSGRAITGVMSPWADASGGASGICKFQGHVTING